MLNGELKQVPEATTVAMLLEQLQIAPERVVVELNVKILKRGEHAGTLLSNGDTVEIVRFVGGGSWPRNW